MIFMRQFFTNSDDSFKASYTLSIVQQTLDKIMNLGIYLKQHSHIFIFGNDNRHFGNCKHIKINETDK